MAYPTTKNDTQVELCSTIYNISSSTAAENRTAVYIPWRCRLSKITCMISNAITSADATITVKQNSTTVGTFTVTQSGSATGSLSTFTPSTVTYLNEADILLISATGSSTACQGYFDVRVKMA